MMMRLQRHTFQVTYKPGKTLWIADTFSCAPHDNANDVDVSSFDLFREDQGQNPRLKDASVPAIRATTAADPF